MELNLNQEPTVRNELKLKRILVAAAGLSIILAITAYFFINATSTSDVSAGYTKTWTGNYGTNWNYRYNWSPRGVPGSSDYAYIPGGRSNYPLINNTVRVYSVRINSASSGATVTVASGGSLTVYSKIIIYSPGKLVQTGGTIKTKGIDNYGDIDQSSGSIFSTADVNLLNGANLVQSGGLIHMASSSSSNPSKDLEIKSGSSAAQTGGTINVQDLEIQRSNATFTQNENTGTSLLTIGHEYENNGGNFTATAGTIKWTGVESAGKGAKMKKGNNLFYNVILEGTKNPGLGKNDKDEFSVAGNWTNNNKEAKLNSKKSIVTFNGSNAQTIGGSYRTKFYDLEIDNSYNASPQVTLGNKIEVKHELSLEEGIISIGSNDIVMGASAKVSGASNTAFVYTGGTGVFKWKKCEFQDKKLFPVGCATSSDGYSPLELTFNRNHTRDDYSVAVVDRITTAGTRTGTPITDNVIKATWFVTEKRAGGTDLNFEFQWEGASREGGKLDKNNELQLMHFTNSDWDEPSGKKAHISGNGPYKCKIRNYTGSFSPFGLGGDGPPLPIELLFFKAEKVGSLVDFTWATASEEGNDFFTLERSKNGIQFTPIGNIEGAGMSTMILNYSYQDVSPEAGRNFYRLKQTDFDKNTSYSQIEMIDFGVDVIGEISLYPNPTSDILHIKGLDKRHDDYTIRIINASGAVVKEMNITNYTDNQNLSVNVSELPTGIYFLGTSDQSINRAVRFIVRH